MHLPRMNKLLKNRDKLFEFIRFCIVGTLAAGLHYGIYYLLQTRIEVNIAYTIGYLVSLIGNFFLTSYLTFHRVPSWKNALGFGGSHFVNYLLHILLFNAFLFLGASRELAPILVLIIAVPINFVLLRWVFKHKKENVKIDMIRLNMKKLWRALSGGPLALVANLLLIYVCFGLCRVLFLCVNYSYFPDLTMAHFFEIYEGGLAFDTSAILYTNALYVLLILFPLHYKENKTYHSVVKWIFIVTNMVCIIVNLMDTVYFQYTNRRTTSTVFSQFSNEDNLGSIIGLEFLRHWYLVLVALGFGYALFKLYRQPNVQTKGHLKSYYPIYLATLLLCIPFCIFGMRGGIGGDVRPITISNANQYVNRPVETALVLNTPFSIYRTLGKKTFVVPTYFPDEQSLQSAFDPVHYPVDSVTFQPKNVVVLIMESFGKEYIGSLNKELEGGNYKGYTPFLDSLISKSLVFEHSFANGRASIDGMPSVLSGIPMFIEAFFLTPASLNKLSSVGGELRKKGYYTAFFHGARGGSMGFQAYSRAVGYSNYFGREEYNNDADYDGNWAIWDEEFLQFYADQISSFKQPFSTGIFTASSHHPFNIPERYQSQFPEGSLPIHKCIRYSDHALKRFFEKASKQPWFENTLFVLTADHTNQTEHPEYQTETGIFSVPIIFYTPTGDLQGHREAIAQQIDIMPTVLGYLGYDKPFVSFGCDLLQTPDEETYAVNYTNGIYQYMKGDYLLQFDGDKAVALYAFKTDKQLKNNLVNTVAQQNAMVEELKGIIQQYMERMNQDRMTVE